VDEDGGRERPRQEEQAREAMGAEQVVIADVDDRPLQREDEEQPRRRTARLEPDHQRGQRHTDDAREQVLDEKPLEVAQRAHARGNVLFEELAVADEQVVHRGARGMALDLALQLACRRHQPAVHGAHDVEGLQPAAIDTGDADQHVLEDGEARRGAADAVPRIAGHHGHHHHGERDEDPVGGRLETAAAGHADRARSGAPA